MCKECDKTFVNFKALKPHLENNIHTKMNTKKDIADFLNKYPEISKLPPSTEHGSFAQERGVFYVCRICNCLFTGPECAKQHLLGKKHRRVKEIMKRLDAVNVSSAQRASSTSDSAADVSSAPGIAPTSNADYQNSNNGQTLVDDKLVFFCRPQPTTVLMVTDPEKQGLLMYVEWPVKKGQRHVKMLRMIEKVPPKAESENEKQPLEVEPEKEKEASTTEPEKETALPQADSKIEKDPPQADSLIEQNPPETESEEKEETPKYEEENVPSEIGEAENVSSYTELTAEKLSPKPEGKGKAGAQMRKPAPKAVVIGNPLPKTEPGSSGKPKVQNAFDFVGEFVLFGSGEELLCVQKEGRDPTALSEDLLVEAIKKKLHPIAKLIKSTMHITPLQSKL